MPVKMCEICTERPAKFVATGGDGIRWLTCGEHGARKHLEPIEQEALVAKQYTSRNVIHPSVRGYIVAWQSNQLTSPLPQWPKIRVEPEQEVIIAIDPSGRTHGMDCMTYFGMRSDTRIETVQLCAIIETDDGKPGSHELLPFPPFKYDE